MPDICGIHDVARLAPALITGILRGFVQAQDPYDKYYDEFGDPYKQAGGMADITLPIGAIIVGTIVSLGLQVMFGFWGKNAADQQGVHPAIGFALGFFFYWMGVKMIPIFRKGRIFNAPVQPSRPEAMNAPNPMYAATPTGYAPSPGTLPPPPVAPPAPPPQVLVADETGYVMCPGCGSRTKAGRKTCMTCGGMLPAVYNPNLK